MRTVLSNDEFFELEEIYKAFGSIPRLKILMHLRDGESIASELSKVSGLSQSATSHQLKDLKMKKIIKSRKEGLNIYYSLQDKHIFKIIECAVEHIQEEHCSDE